MCNVLLNDGKNYNKKRRKKTKQNRKARKKKQKHKKNSERGQDKKKDKEREPVKPKKVKVDKLKKRKFEETDRISIIAFGDSMQNKDTVRLKGHESGTTGILYKKLKKRAKRLLTCVVDINEFRTSKVCNGCKVYKLDYYKLPNGKDLDSLLECKTCRKLWNRDVNASNNMLDISLSVWKEEGRPTVFTRQGIAVADTVQPEREV